jgi:hypothetical protein
MGRSLMGKHNIAAKTPSAIVMIHTGRYEPKIEDIPAVPGPEKRTDLVREKHHAKQRR